MIAARDETTIHGSVTSRALSASAEARRDRSREQGGARKEGRTREEPEEREEDDDPGEHQGRGLPRLVRGVEALTEPLELRQRVADALRRDRGLLSAVESFDRRLQVVDRDEPRDPRPIGDEQRSGGVARPADREPFQAVVPVVARPGQRDGDRVGAGTARGRDLPERGERLLAAEGRPAPGHEAARGAVCSGVAPGWRDLNSDVLGAGLRCNQERGSSQAHGYNQCCPLQLHKERDSR